MDKIKLKVKESIHKETINAAHQYNFIMPITIRFNPFFTAEEKWIVAFIMFLSNKYDEKGCTLTNKDIAEANDTNIKSVSRTISKATKLGWVKDRFDEIKTLKVEGRTTVIQIRKFKIIQTKEWEIYNVVLNYAYLNWGTEKEKQEAIKFIQEFKKIIKDKKIENKQNWQKDIKSIIQNMGSVCSFLKHI